MTARAEVVGGLRAWARGAYAEEAAVELLARAFGGRFAGTGWPWVRACDRPGWWWLDPDPMTTESGMLSGGERRVLVVVAALLDGDPLADLGSVLAGIDRTHLELVLAAFAHAGGSHQHSELVVTDDGAVRFRSFGPLFAWPAADGVVPV